MSETRLEISRPNPGLSLRPLAPGEHRLLAALRIQALKDSPDQFGESLANALGRSESDWKFMAETMTLPASQAMFILEQGTNPAGCVFALHDSLIADGGRIGGMWVSPAVRRSGGGMALVAAVVDWARRQEKSRLRLWVGEENRAGRQLYAKCGFGPTGSRKPFSESDFRMLMELEKIL